MVSARAPSQSSNVYITGIYLVGKSGASETGTDRLRAVVNTGTELWAPNITVNLLPSQAIVSTSRRTVVLQVVIHM